MQACRSLLPLVLALSLASCSAPQVKMRTANLGDRIEVGHIIYTVFDTQWLTQIGQGVDAKIPQNRYFLIRLSAANSSSSPVMIPAATIEDDDGKTYNEISYDVGAPNWLGMLREVKTAEAAQGNIAFDVPPRHYKLRISDENEQNPVLVDIPLSLGSEFMTPLPGGDKK
jgi:hypothetical protein